MHERMAGMRGIETMDEGQADEISLGYSEFEAVDATLITETLS